MESDAKSSLNSGKGSFSGFGLTTGLRGFGGSGRVSSVGGSGRLGTMGLGIGFLIGCFTGLVSLGLGVGLGGGGVGCGGVGGDGSACADFCAAEAFALGAAESVTSRLCWGFVDAIAAGFS